MIKYSTYNLKKVENILKENQYIIRYEKGNFKAGYCVLHEKKVVVVNRFFSTEAKINCLIEVMDQVNIVIDMLSEISKPFYLELKKEFSPI